MNIVLVNDFAFVNGGAGQVALSTAKLLAERGENVVIFSAVGPVDSELLKINNLKIICLNQYDVLHDPYRLRAIIQGIWNFKARHRFAELLDGMSPKETIIHIHTLQKAISTSIIGIAKRRGFKVIYHLHDYGIACPNLGFFDYKHNVICDNKAMSLGCLLKNCDSRKYLHKWWRVIRQYVQNNICGLKKVDCFIYISKFSLQVLKEYLSNCANLEYLPNMADIVKEPRVKAENNNLVVYVGRLSPEKNPQILAQIAKEINGEVLFIGGGVCEKEIKAINDEVKISGWVSQDEVHKMLGKARVLVFPSKCYETQGLSVMEAMACGIPVIVSDNCAARELVDEGKTGMLFNNDDIKSLKEKILYIQDYEVLKRMSITTYDAYWNNNKSNDEYINELERIYIKLLNDY